jgi:homoserine dehydrogenase
MEDKSAPVKTVPLAVTGFGNVGRAFFSLLREKSEDLERRYGLAFDVLAVAQRAASIAAGLSRSGISPGAGSPGPPATRPGARG